MRLALVTIGTRGDFAPFFALALGLRGAGHDVTLATHRDFEREVIGAGLRFKPVGGSFKELLETQAGRDWIESADSLLRYEKAARRAFAPLADGLIKDTHAALEGAEAVLFHPFANGAYHTAELKQVPGIAVSLIPFVSTKQMPPLFFPRAPRWLWGWLQEQSFAALQRAVYPAHEKQRAALGLPPFQQKNWISHLMNHQVPVVHLYSEHVFHRPTDWGERVHVTGFCHSPPEPAWQPPPALLDFLAQQPAPIYVGFGSMTGRDPEALTDLTLEALALAKQRAVLVTGWGGLHSRKLPDTVFAADSVPHDWLFPRVSAVVHHCGAGTMAAGLRAGRPTLAVAFFGDQPFWGRAVASLGAGPAPILRKQLTARRLAEGIAQTVATDSYRQAAEAVGTRLRAEDGVARAVAVIEKLLSARAARFRSHSPASAPP